MVVAKLEELLVEGWVIGETADRVVIDFEAIGDGFDSDGGAGSISHNPVKFGSGEMFGKVEVAEVHFVEEDFGFGDRGALRENPRQELKLGDIIFTLYMVEINGITNEVEPSNTKAFFVHGIIE